jgi:hypothetical protein
MVYDAEKDEYATMSVRSPRETETVHIIGLGMTLVRQHLNGDPPPRQSGVIARLKQCGPSADHPIGRLIRIGLHFNFRRAAFPGNLACFHPEPAEGDLLLGHTEVRGGEHPADKLCDRYLARLTGSEVRLCIKELQRLARNVTG